MPARGLDFCLKPLLSVCRWVSLLSLPPPSLGASSFRIVRSVVRASRCILHTDSVGICLCAPRDYIMRDSWEGKRDCSLALIHCLQPWPTMANHGQPWPTMTNYAPKSHASLWAESSKWPPIKHRSTQTRLLLALSHLASILSTAALVPGVVQSTPSFLQSPVSTLPSIPWDSLPKPVFYFP